jgi:endoglucanase
MNEPHSMPTETWRDAANAAILGIRAAGATNLILVPGNAWTGAHSWLDNWYGTPNGTVMLTISDPINHFAFEVHQYLDADSSGTSGTCQSTTIGSQRLANFTAWCRANGRRSFLGEFGVSANASCLQALDDMLTYVEANADVWLGWTYWAAGPWWGNYMFSIEPNAGMDRPQMDGLEPHIPIPAPMLTLVAPNLFEFKAEPGILYHPETLSELSALSWTNYGSSISGTGQTATVEVQFTNGFSGFYRVRAQRSQ